MRLDTIHPVDNNVKLSDSEKEQYQNKSES